MDLTLKSIEISVVRFPIVYKWTIKSFMQEARNTLTLKIINGDIDVPNGDIIRALEIREIYNEVFGFPVG